MNNAKEFYEVYDIPHPKKLLQREELLFEILTKGEHNYLTHIKNQEELIDHLILENRNDNINKKLVYTGLFGAVAGIVILVGMLASNGEKQALQKQIQVLTQQKELSQNQFQRKEQELEKRIEILIEENEQLKSADATLLKKENEQLKDKNAQLNSEIIRLNRGCIGKVCLR
jgi:uncharacterized protein HemX